MAAHLDDGAAVVSADRGWVASAPSVPQRADDAPPAHGGPRRHGQRAEQLDPKRHAKNWRAQKTERRRQAIQRPALRARKQDQREDAHGFLGVVGSMAKPHERGAGHLQAAEHAVNEVWALAVQQPNSASTSSPPMIPSSGEAIIGAMTRQPAGGINRPADHRPAAIRGSQRAPHSPPISAADWPAASNHVNRFRHRAQSAQNGLRRDVGRINLCRCRRHGRAHQRPSRWVSPPA